MSENRSSTPEEKALALPLRAVKLNEPGGFEFGWCAVDAEDRVIGYCMTETQAKQLVAPFLSSEREETVDGFDVQPVLLEVMRAIRKFPTWPTDPLHALAVLGEEFGELTKAMVQLTYEPHKTSAEEVQKEALQTAAMALRLCHSLNRYEYKPGVQHEQ